jgi:hypothetical protein
MEFIDDLASRLANRVQLTTDGHKAYLYAVDAAFGGEVDFAQLVKLYGAAPESAKGRYLPAECTGIIKTRVIGDPDMKHVSTSYAGRNNLNIRMHSRRMTRLHSQKRWRTTLTRWRFTSSITISSASIKRSRSRPQWQRA